MKDETRAREYAEAKEQATQREWSAYGDIRMQAFLDGIRSQRESDALLCELGASRAKQLSGDLNIGKNFKLEQEFLAEQLLVLANIIRIQLGNSPGGRC